MLYPLVQPLIRPLIRPMDSVFPSGGGAAAPEPPMTDLAAWYRKDTGITSAGNAVSQWDDQSGNARHLVQATGAIQPTLQGDGTIKFASDYMTATFALVAPYTVYMLMKQTLWNDGRNIFVLWNYGGGVSQRTATPQIALFAGSLVANTDMTLDTWSNLCAVFKAGATAAGSILRVDAVSNTGAPGLIASNMTGLTVGANTDGDAPLADATVAEILVYAADHDATLQDEVFAYLDTVTP